MGGPRSWVGLEFIRTHALSGFPWGVLGYSQYANLLLVQMADIFGVLGISFVTVACNGALAMIWPRIRSRGGSPGKIPGEKSRRFIIAPA